MKKSDLPWILPLLTAWSQGKTLQVRSESGRWVDYDTDMPIPRFDTAGGASSYRIKPELKAPGEIARANFGSQYKFSPWAASDAKQEWNQSALAVIKAYKAGELDIKE